VTERHIGLKAMYGDRADPRCDSVQLRVVPGDWESDRSIEKDAEVIGIVGVFPEKVCIHDEPAANPLLESGIKLIAGAGLDRRRLRAKDILSQTARAGAARENQVLVEGGLKSPGVGDAKHGIRLGKEIGNR
jgi:hypothetical protein